ncbi:hypothetical protein JHN53_35920 [Streptomyces sp. MBT58]|uniref:hypothetical protein n=1 Tax=Streptomyces sp. MBT58 TaxID=1488389 RepID=UPI0019147665|nr:hypothetical protein [Streptomyces sp. MBT58]MBK5996904.1 hypothetical protein [Streptomyces sp. MBT58]
MPAKAVLFDYKTILLKPGTPAAAETAVLLHNLVTEGLQWCILSTDPLSPAQIDLLQQLGYPTPSLLIDQSHIAGGKRRGSPAWIDAVTTALHLRRYELLYVGCTAMDWRTAINSGVMYQHAAWAGSMPSGTTSLVARTPSDVDRFLEMFLSADPSWSHRADQGNWSLRSLLPASALLPSTSPGPTFRLQDVFTYKKPVKIGDADARSVLMLFVLANAYLENLIPANPYFCIYPSSTSGQVSERLKTYLDKAAALFHGYYREDLLVRAVNAPDTSLERWKASQGQAAQNISIATQAQTVHLGPGYRGKLGTKTVVVLDDFTTHGMSLEWARLLLTAAGAQRIVMLTVGKYGSRHTRYDLKDPSTLAPYQLNSLTADSFTTASLTPEFDLQAQDRLYQRLATSQDLSKD